MRKLVAVMGLVVLMAAACGDSGDTASSSGTGTGTETGDTKEPVKLTGTTNNHGGEDVSGKDDAEVELELDNFYFAPTYIKAKGGQKVTVKLKNEGSTPHTFTMADGPDEQLAPGDTKTVTVTAPSGQVLVYYCRFHQGQGMQGAFYEHAGDSAGTGASGSSGGGSTSTSGGYGY